MLERLFTLRGRSLKNSPLRRKGSDWTEVRCLRRHLGCGVANLPRLIEQFQKLSLRPVGPLGGLLLQYLTSDSSQMELAVSEMNLLSQRRRQPKFGVFFGVVGFWVSDRFH